MAETENAIAVSISDAASLLSVSTFTIRRLIRDGTLRHVRVGNSIRIRRVDLDEYLDDRATTEWIRVDGRGRRPARSTG